MAQITAAREAKLEAAADRKAVREAEAHPTGDPHFRTFNWYEA